MCVCVYEYVAQRQTDGKTEFAVDLRTADTAACAHRRAEKREVWQKRGISEGHRSQSLSSGLKRRKTGVW